MFSIQTENEIYRATYNSGYNVTLTVQAFQEIMFAARSWDMQKYGSRGAEVRFVEQPDGSMKIESF